MQIYTTFLKQNIKYLKNIIRISNNSIAKGAFIYIKTYFFLKKLLLEYHVQFLSM